MHCSHRTTNANWIQCIVPKLNGRRRPSILISRVTSSFECMRASVWVAAEKRATVYIYALSSLSGSTLCGATFDLDGIVCWRAPHAAIVCGSAELLPAKAHGRLKQGDTVIVKFAFVMQCKAASKCVFELQIMRKRSKDFGCRLWRALTVILRFRGIPIPKYGSRLDIVKVRLGSLTSDRFWSYNWCMQSIEWTKNCYSLDFPIV